MNKVHIFGDSISSGIGSLMLNYCSMLQDMLPDGYEVENHALTGTTVKYCLAEIEKYTYDCADWVVVFYGNVDAQIRPNTKGKFFAHIPKRYKQGGMLIPRPLYSKNLKKRVLEYFDNIVRKVLNFFVVTLDGYEQWISLEEFASTYELIVNKLKKSTEKVVLVSTVYLDEKYFPNSNMQYKQFNNVIRKIADTYKADYIDLYNIIKNQITINGDWESFYLKDHFHPNISGYRIIAGLIADHIQKEK